MSKTAKIVLIVSVTVVFFITLSAAIAAGSLLTDNANANDLKGEISASEATAVAMEDAGLDQEDVTVTRRRLYKDGSDKVYDIEFYTVDKNDTTEYFYLIDADSGEIEDSSKKVKNLYTVPEQYAASSERTEETITENEPVTGNETETGSSTDGYIGVNKAKSLALKDAGLNKSEARIFSVELKTGLGKAYYEVDFGSAGIEYEFDVDAKSGRILSREVEYPDDDDDYDYDDDYDDYDDIDD